MARQKLSGPKPRSAFEVGMEVVSMIAPLEPRVGDGKDVGRPFAPATRKTLLSAPRARQAAVERRQGQAIWDA